MREVRFQNKEYYHVYNRGVDKREIFMDKKDYIRFLRSMREFNNRLGDSQRDYIRRMAEGNKRSDFRYLKSDLLLSLVDIICYCLIPNHFHLILKQLVNNGITEFMRKLGTGYTAYFNAKYNRSGHLFQGKFKTIHITTDDYLLWLSGYVNGNIEIHKIAKVDSWPWSSCKDYLGLRNGTLCNENIILRGFEDLNDYQEFVNMVIRESGERKDEIKNYFLE